MTRALAAQEGILTLGGRHVRRWLNDLTPFTTRDDNSSSR